MYALQTLRVYRCPSPLPAALSVVDDDDESIYCPSQLASYADIHGLYQNIAILE
jgi:hypothetical protein